MIPQGVIPPVLTPLDMRQEIDADAFRQLLDKLIAGGVDALFVAGTAGLGSMLTGRQYEQLLAVASEGVGGRCPLITGVLEPSTARSVERLGILRGMAFDAAVTLPPYYCRAHDETQLLRHFELLRNASELDLVFYNIPACTGVTVSVEFICKLRRRGLIAACKDSSGDPAYFAELCRKGRECGLMVFQGMRPNFASLAELEADGCVPVPGNVRPELFSAAWKQRSNPDALRPLQERCDELWRELVVGCDFFSRSVAALAEQGIGGGIMPEPFTTRRGGK